MRAFCHTLMLAFWLVALPVVAAEYKWGEVTKAASFCERDGAGAATFDGKMWLLGGWADDPAGGSAHVGYNDVWNTTDGLNWTRVRKNSPKNPGIWEGRHCGGYVVFHDKMWIVGGDPLLKHYQNEVWSSADGVSWRKDATAPWAPRQYHSVAVFDNRMWVLAGGNTSTPGYNRNDVWYSSDGVNWTELPDTPWPTRHAATVFVYDGHLWVVAGSHPGSTPIHDVWRLAPIHAP